MDLATLIAKVVSVAAVVLLLVTLAARAVRYAKKGSPGAQVLGAAFLFFSMGNMRDPTDDIVQQAKQLKNEGDASGDPPDDDDRN